MDQVSFACVREWREEGKDSCKVGVECGDGMSSQGTHLSSRL